MANESIFRVSGETNFENFSARHQTWRWHLPGFDVSTGLPKKTLDTSLTYIFLEFGILLFGNNKLETSLEISVRRNYFFQNFIKESSDG